MDFFAYERELPAGYLGFSLFDRSHLCWLAAIALCCAVTCYHTRRAGRQTQRRVRLVVGLLSLALELLRLCYLFWRGYLSVYEWPLHLCGLSVFLCAADAIHSRAYLRQCLYGLCLPGALCGLLFCDWVTYPLWNFTGIHGFVCHGVLLLYPLLGLSTGHIRPRRRDVWMPLSFLLLAAPPIYLLDRAVNANFLFLLVPSRGSPLEAMAAVLGNPGYLLGYFALVLAVELVLFVPFRGSADTP